MSEDGNGAKHLVVDQQQQKSKQYKNIKKE